MTADDEREFVFGFDWSASLSSQSSSWRESGGETPFLFFSPAKQTPYFPIQRGALLAVETVMMRDLGTVALRVDDNVGGSGRKLGL